MKKVVPFIFPLIALVIVLGLLFRWYSLRTNSDGQISPAAQSIEVSDITSEEENRLARPAQDLQSVNLTPTSTDSAVPAQGRVRYEMVDGKVNFSVSATLPELKTGRYQVWLRSEGEVTKAMVLRLQKGGWMASGSVSGDHLPLEITVSHEEMDDDTMEQVMLKAQIEAAQ